MGRTEIFLDPTHVGGSDPQDHAENVDEMRRDPLVAGPEGPGRGHATVMLRES